MDDVTIIHGDCREVMAGMPDGSVDAVVTDPPYGTGEWQRPEPGLGKRPKAKFTKAEWDVWDTAWLDHARRVCSGPIMFFCPVKQIGDVIRYAEANGEPWRLMAWCKSDPMPTFTKQVAFGLEPVVVLRPKEATGGRDWIEASSPKQATGRDRRDHPHQKPAKVARWLCEMTPPGALILEPFAGSGTTPEACMKTGRRCIAVESDARYIPVIRRRVKDAETPLFHAVSVDALDKL